MALHVFHWFGESLQGRFSMCLHLSYLACSACMGPGPYILGRSWPDVCLVHGAKCNSSSAVCEAMNFAGMSVDDVLQALSLSSVVCHRIHHRRAANSCLV